MLKENYIFFFSPTEAQEEPIEDKKVTVYLC